MDFGAGLGLDELNHMSGYIHGTPALMAPELFNQQHAGLATDIYALGSTVFKLATGRYPTDDTDLQAIRRSHELGQYAVLKSLRPDLPTQFADLIQNMVATDAHSRPETAGIIRALYDIETAPQRRRNKIAMWSVIGLLVVGSTVSTWGFYQANQAKNTAIIEQQKSETMNVFLQDMLQASAELGGGRDVRVVDVLDGASERLFNEPPEDKVLAAQMHASLASSYNALNDVEKSNFHASSSFDLAAAIYEPHEEPYVNSQLEVIGALSDAGKHEQSNEIIADLIASAEAKLGNSHWYIQRARKFYVTNLLFMAKYDEAIQALDLHFAEVPDPATAKNNLGFEILQARTNALREKGRYDEAIEVAQEAINWLATYPSKSLLNERSVRTALGLAQLEIGAIDAGVDSLNQVLVLIEKIYGVDSDAYVDGLINLGAAQRLQQNPELAMETTMQAYDLAKRIYGAEQNQKTITIGGNLANMLVDMGDLVQGEAVMRESLDLSYQLLGEKKPTTLIFEYNLAELLNKKGQYQEALEWAISTHVKKTETFGPQHPFVFLSLDNWAISLRGMNQHQQALAKHQAAVDGIQASVGANHQYALLVRQHHMDTLEAAGVLVDNDPRLQQLVNDLTQTLGADDPATQRYHSLLEGLK